MLHRIAIRELNLSDLSDKHKVYIQQTAAAAACSENSIIVETLKISHTHLIIGPISGGPSAIVAPAALQLCSSMPHKSVLRPPVALY